MTQYERRTMCFIFPLCLRDLSNLIWKPFNRRARLSTIRKRMYLYLDCTLRRPSVRACEPLARWLDHMNTRNICTAKISNTWLRISSTSHRGGRNKIAVLTEANAHLYVVESNQPGEIIFIQRNATHMHYPSSAVSTRMLSDGNVGSVKLWLHFTHT